MKFLKKMCVLLLLNVLTMLLFTAGNVQAGINAWTSNGPYGGDVKSLAINPITPTTLYAGTSSGSIFRSTDSGATWSSLVTGSAAVTITALAIDPSAPSTLYAGTNGGLFRSTDSGATWSSLVTGSAAAAITALAIGPPAPSTLYAGTRQGILKSIDGGANWSVLNTELANMKVTALAVAASGSGILYAATHGGLVVLTPSARVSDTFINSSNSFNWDRFESAYQALKARTMPFVVSYATTTAAGLGSISGTVTDGINPVSGISVYVKDLNYNYLSSSNTDTTGNYTVLGIPTGSYKVEFDGSSSGYVIQWYNNKADFNTADPVSVTEPATTIGINATLVHAATTLGGVPAEGNLKITINDNGTIAIYRYITGAWQQQIYAGNSKGSRLQINGVGYSLGYYAGTLAALVSNIKVSDTKITSVWTAGGTRITLDTTYQPGASYFGMQWTITNESGGSLNDLRFFHGEDTYFYNSDNGGGYWDTANNTVGVQKTISGQLMRMSLQGITAPYAYDSMSYYSVYNNVGAGALTNIINSLESTDNGYALEWRKTSMQNGETWTIAAYEKFADVAIGSVSVTAPTQTDCSIGSICNLNFTVTNISQASATVSLSVSSSQTSWNAQILAPASPTVIPVGSSQQVNVQVSIPASAMDGVLGNVTLSASDGTNTASDVAAVRAVSNSFTVTPSAGTGGSISPSTPQTVNANATISFTVTPDAGYTASIGGTCGGSLVGNTYTTLPITANCTVVASFTATSTYTVTPSAGAGGSISPSTPQTVNANATISFTVTPDAGYTASIGGTCGGTLSGNTYTTGSITANCTVSAIFTALTTTYTVTSTAGTGGSISPASTTVNSGNTTSFTVAPSTGYNLSSVTGCGGTLSGNTYTTGPITANCTVSAIFTAKVPTTYTVTSTAGTGGSISPASATVNSGNTTSFTVTPDTGYSISSVSGCSGTLLGNTYTTGAITANCTVTASFSANPVNGACGSANGGIFTTTPAGNLCSTGTASAITGSGPWTWTCNGANGGTNASCSASLQTYTVTASAGTGGTISCNPTTVNSGSSSACTITPDAGYNIASVAGCGGILGGNIYTTGPITTNCAVSATFKTTLTITTPSGPIEVAPSGSFTISTAGASNVVVDGISIGAVNIVTFINITGPHTITW